MGIVMQLLIETCEFPNNTSPREWLARKETSAQYLIAAGTVVNHAAKFSSRKQRSPILPNGLN
jgi:hypothetical protein